MKKIFRDKQLFIRRFLLVCYDCIAVFIAAMMSLLTRFDFSYSKIPHEYLNEIFAALPFMIAFTVLIFILFRLYSSLWSYAGAYEMVFVAGGCLVDTVVVTVIILLRNWGNLYPVPRSFYPIYGIYILMLIIACRYFYRLLRTLRSIKRNGTGAKRNVLVIGAGSAGNQIIKEINANSAVRKRVVGVIDDDPSKKGSFIHGARVVGGRKNIVAKAADLEVDEIIIAMPSASPAEIKDIINICKETGCELKKLPGIYQLVNGDVSVKDIKDVDANDLLGREPVKVDLDAIMDYVCGRTIMVTGGGGSIGSELCRQIAVHGPKRLIIVDIYENTTYEIQNELKTNFPNLDLVVLIASVRNTNRMNWIFETYKPEIIYHAAAHKHVPLMETSPNEAVKNNIFGTLKIVQAADHYGVKKFVMISTDKAVNPTNVMGATKRVCEMIIQTYNRRSATDYVAVRFGNVLGSSGSVIPLFKKQIENGGPVTVTHPDIIRYFMTIPEAVSLVLQAGVYAKGGEIFVLDMGEPVKILDLARNLIILSGHKPDEDIEIVFTGLRPGEKLYEELLMDEEGLTNTANDKIFIGKPMEIDDDKFLAQLEELNKYVVTEPLDIRTKLMEIVPTYHPEEAGIKNEKL